MARRITILGMGPSASERQHDIARYCEGTEIWSLNNAYNRFPQLVGGGFSRFYELHSWQYLKKWSAGTEEGAREVNHWEKLAQIGCTVYTGQHIPLVQNQYQMDWDKLWKHWHEKLFRHASGSAVNTYFLGSPSIMLAHALYEHDQGDTIEYIQSLGIDTADDRHKQQRQSWSFWVGQALARGIEVGGTACGYMLEHENDEGLRGLREIITAQINKTTPKTGPVDDYTVVTFCTPSEKFPGLYESGVNRLRAWCKDVGLDFIGKVEKAPKDILEIEAAEDRNRATRQWILHRKPEVVVKALEKTDKPVFFLDCDDEFLGKPTFPVCDVGFLRNPEKDLPSTAHTHLEIASSGLIAPTPDGKRFAAKWLEYSLQASEHRALQMAWTQLCQRDGHWGDFKDVTGHMTGLYKIHAAPNGHRKETVIYGTT